MIDIGNVHRIETGRLVLSRRSRSIIFATKSEAGSFHLTISGISIAIPFPSSSLVSSSMILSFYCFLVVGKTGESTPPPPLLSSSYVSIKRNKSRGGWERIFAFLQDARPGKRSRKARRVIATFILAAHREAKNAIRALNSLLHGAAESQFFVLERSLAPRRQLARN